MARFILSVKIVRKSETWYTENKKSFVWKRGTDFETYRLLMRENIRWTILCG